MGQVERTFEQMGHTMNDTTIFCVSEASVSNRLGVSVAVIRSLRGVEGEDWVTGKNRRRLWSEAAVEKAAALLHEKGAPDTTSSTESRLGPSGNAVPPENPLESLTVARGGFHNRLVLHAVENGETYDPRAPRVVHVRDNRNFAAGMVILARRVRERATVYEFEGNPDNPAAGRRLPRRFGKW